MSTSDLINITILVPNGTVTHDDGHVLCVYGNSWRATLYITTFFLINYAAHAATIKSNPGDRTSVTICNMALALFFPVSGLMRAINAIVRFGRLGDSDLEKACRSGALCMVVRMDGWLPVNGQTLHASVIETTSAKILRTRHDANQQLSNSDDPETRGIQANVKIYRPNYAVEGSSTWLYSDVAGGRANVNLALTKIHGTYSLPQGYRFAILPRDTRLLEWTKEGDIPSIKTPGNSEIAYTYSMAKAVISIIQSIAALTILLGHRKDVVHKWGYASFHLTILPYLIMTIFNFASNICTADYDGLYMVETLVMDEARARGGQFEGTVAATYTATTFRSQTAQQLSNSELRSYNGLEHNHIRSAAQILANVELYFPFVFLQDLSVKRRMQESTTCTTTRVTAVAHANDTDDSDMSQTNHSERHTGQQSVELDRRSDTEQETAKDKFPSTLVSKIWHWILGESPDGPIKDATVRHTCGRTSLASSLDLGTPADTAVALWTGSGSYFVPRLPPVPLSLVAAMKHDISINIKERVYYHADKFERFMLDVHGMKDTSPANRNASQGFLSALKSECVRLLRFNIVYLRFISGLARVQVASCGACEQMRASDIKKTTLYFPMCDRFLRSDDIPAEIDENEILARPVIDVTNPLHSRCGRLSIDLPVRRWHRSIGGVLAQLGIGSIVIGLTVVLIGWQSNWFSAGQASKTQRVIILLWMSEGVFGMLLAFLSLNEIVLTFFLFPLYVLIYQHSFSRLIWPGGIQTSGQMFMMALTPLTIFIAPIWGFVIVGKMLVEWGQCVTLYH